MACSDQDLRGRRTRVDASAQLTRTVLWDDVVVEAAAELVECIVGDGVVVPRGSRYHRQTIVRAEDVPHTPAGRVEGALLLTPLPERP
jgi:ADP-glucose pyrophosphorylase